MKKYLPQQCPGCGNKLKVKVLSCDKCSTEVSGMFDLPTLSRLSDEDQSFIVEFVKSSGSLKDMASQMKLSYPTIRNRLDELIEKIKKVD